MINERAEVRQKRDLASTAGVLSAPARGGRERDRLWLPRGMTASAGRADVVVADPGLAFQYLPYCRM
jgi:hypothetical protein